VYQHFFAPAGLNAESVIEKAIYEHVKVW